MQEEREKGGGGPHFSKWHLEQSGGQLAAHAGVWGSGPLSHALWLGVEPRDGPAHQTWSGVQFGGVSSRQHLREAPGVPPKLAARLSHSYSPAWSPVERLVADRGCRMRSGEEAGPAPTHAGVSSELLARAPTGHRLGLRVPSCQPRSDAEGTAGGRAG